MRLILFNSYVPRLLVQSTEMPLKQPMPLVSLKGEGTVNPVDTLRDTFPRESRKEWSLGNSVSAGKGKLAGMSGAWVGTLFLQRVRYRLCALQDLILLL